MAMLKTLIFVMMGAWVLFEILLIVRDRRHGVRHPSYTGMLVITVGFGIAFASWLSLVLCAVLPLLALLRRIKVEESELVRVLGEPYRAYSARTKRLVPGIW
jgi:protein-S-isoprenylcysteine O-methyltransferase Ste14